MYAPSTRRVRALVIEELSTFTTESLGSILSEALTVAGNPRTPLRPTSLSALFGNTGTLAAFAVGAADAVLLVPDLAQLSAEQLVTLDRFRIAAR